MSNNNNGGKSGGGKSIAIAADTSSGNDDNYLKILICSANVGNAEPTPNSFGAWVPCDGDIATALNNTKYPVGYKEFQSAVGPYGASNNDNNARLEIINSFKSGCSNDESNNEYCRKNKFDIIVLGMQEAAFVNKQKKDLQQQQDAPPSAGTTFSEDEQVEEDCKAASINNSSSPQKEEEKKRRAAITNKLFKNSAKKVTKVGMAVRGVSASQTYKRTQSDKDGTERRSSRNLEQRINILGYDSNKLHDLIKSQCPSYEIITSNLRGQMRLFVLAHTSITEEISDVYVAAENTGLGSIMANKGGIIVTLTLRNLTRISFMNCHLEAHEGVTHYNNRNKNLSEILGGAKTDTLYNMQDASIISHHMFLCGDLNYRIKFFDYDLSSCASSSSLTTTMKKNNAKRMLPKSVKKIVEQRLSASSRSPGVSAVRGMDTEGVGDVTATAEEENESNNNNKADGGAVDPEAANGSHFDQAKALVEAEDWKALNDGDELAEALRQKECLVGFSTLPCHWPPTFKVERGDGYHYNEKRTPSYTDRILWKSAEGMVNNIIPFLYEPCPEFVTSDHKPIRGGFAVKLNTCRREQKNSISDNMTTKANCDGIHLLEHHRQIEVLVSDMKCKNLPVMDNELMGGLSDPYVLFTSSPKEFLYSKASRRELLYSKAWPSSSIITKNLNPVWNEDIHLTMDGKGMRNGCLVEGSMLTLTVMDYDSTSGDDVIGSVALNLNELCSELDFCGNGGPSDSKVQETFISRPILRNGQEYGVLECKIKMAFLTPKEVKSFLAGAKNIRNATKTSLKSKLRQAFSALSL